MRRSQLLSHFGKLVELLFHPKWSVLFVDVIFVFRTVNRGMLRYQFHRRFVDFVLCTGFDLRSRLRRLDCDRFLLSNQIIVTNIDRNYVFFFLIRRCFSWRWHS